MADDFDSFDQFDQPRRSSGQRREFAERIVSERLNLAPAPVIKETALPPAVVQRIRAQTLADFNDANYISLPGARLPVSLTFARQRGYAIEYTAGDDDPSTND